MALIDIRLPPTHSDEGLRAASEIRRRSPSIAMLVLSQYVEAEYALRLLEGNERGVGYLLKDRILEVHQLTEAITRVVAGGVVVDPELVAQLLERRRRADPLDELTLASESSQSDGRRSDRSRDCAAALRNAKDGGDAHPTHLPEAEPPAERARQQARSCRSHYLRA